MELRSGTSADGIPVRTKECRHGRFSYLAHDAYVGRSLDLYGEFSDHEIRVLSQFCPAGSVFVEAGANIGALTVPLARTVGAGGRVIAFEPQPAMAALLRHNLAANGLANVEVRQAALGRAAGTLHVPPLDYGAPNNFGGVALRSVEDLATGGATVPVDTIDGLALPRLDLLKVDVEGMEIEVVSGALDTIRRLQPALYLENDRTENSRALIELVQSLAYRAWWHCPWLFNPQNFFGNTENVFPRIRSINLLCLPASSAHRIVNAIEVDGPDDTWPAAYGRSRK